MRNIFLQESIKMIIEKKNQAGHHPPRKEKNAGDYVQMIDQHRNLSN